MDFGSKLLSKAVDELSALPGVGRRTALRYVLYLLRQTPEKIAVFTESINSLYAGLRHCTECYYITESERCTICSNPVRDDKTIMIVSDIRDVLAIENTGQYRGKYHVLGGIISPMDGTGPGDLQIELLEKRVQERQIEELIFALPASLEGETTSFYLHRKLKPFGIPVSVLARGLGVSDELEYADELSLSRSIQHRTPFEKPNAIQ